MDRPGEAVGPPGNASCVWRVPHIQAHQPPRPLPRPHASTAQALKERHFDFWFTETKRQQEVEEVELRKTFFDREKRAGMAGPAVAAAKVPLHASLISPLGSLPLLHALVTWPPRYPLARSPLPAIAFAPSPAP